MLVIWCIIIIFHLKFIVKIISIKVFFIISCNSWRTCRKQTPKLAFSHLRRDKKTQQTMINAELQTFVTFIARVALRTTLMAFTSFVLITRPANWESTLRTSHKQVPILLQSNLISANSANLLSSLSSRRPMLH